MGNEQIAQLCGVVCCYVLFGSFGWSVLQLWDSFKGWHLRQQNTLRCFLCLNFPGFARSSGVILFAASLFCFHLAFDLDVDCSTTSLYFFFLQEKSGFCLSSLVQLKPSSPIHLQSEREWVWAVVWGLHTWATSAHNSMSLSFRYWYLI